ncbi:hypothetical protein [Arenicella xantha]|uniref:Uncharacterized protein n=1 Tax=Arenicella xantha TaxID=644221 RepID=A0A395JS95_9GAMM|nr:hypothetical protein [Arenicella xantha]RBP53212.1 hypothetical protein DFR28_101597 [Arenicella xantha]
MDTILNNREIASLIWLAIIGILFLYKPEVRKIVFGLVKLAFGPTSLKLILILASYVGSVVYGLKLLNFWGISDLKLTMMWFALVAIPAIYVASSQEHTSFAASVTSWIKSNLRFLVILEFLVGLQTFSLVGEFIFILIVSVLAIISVVADIEEKTQKVKILLDWVLAIIGVFLVVRAMSYVGDNIEKLTNQRTFKDFVLGPCLSLFLLPFSYAIHLFVKYNNIFSRIDRFCPKPLVFRAKCISAITFRENTKLASEWVNCFLRSTIDTKKALRDSIRLYSNLPRRFDNPAPVLKELGWSPYITLNLLERYGLNPFIYQPILENDWGGETNRLKFGDRSLANAVTFRVDGNEDVASYLKLSLEINYQQDNADDLLELYREMGNALANEVMGIDLPNALDQAIKNVEKAEYEDEFYRLEVDVDDYRDKSAGFSVFLKMYHLKAYQAYTAREPVY